MASLFGRKTDPFAGWSVARAAFLLAMFGWGLGFYGPPIFLKTLREVHDWPVALISTAVTVHFLVGAVTGANIPALHSRFGAVAVTRTCAVAMAVGLVGWALAIAPWHIFGAALLTGGGWGGMSAAALNTIVSPWFDRLRPRALAMAYNGGSIGGVIFSPLWVAAIAGLGFTTAIFAIGTVMLLTVWFISGRYFSDVLVDMGLAPDGDVPAEMEASGMPDIAVPLAGSLLWRDTRFITLAAGMAFGLFAQIGLVAHLYSLLSPALGSQAAGFAMALVTAMAIAGRSLLGRNISATADRRRLACAGYAAQFAGSCMFVLASGQNVPLLLAGVVLFGAGFGNATSLPPLIAQVEFAKPDVTRAVALVVGMAQAAYSFAPAAFGLLRDYGPQAEPASRGAAPFVFAMAAIFQGLAIAAFVTGRR